MTVPSTALREDYDGNGLTENFDYGWQIDAKTELLVTRVTISNDEEVTLTVDADYTVTGVLNPAGGQVIITPALSDLYHLVITPNVPEAQEIDFTTESSVPPDRVEKGLDRLAIQVKQLSEKISRAVLFSVGSLVTDANDFLQQIIGYTAAAAASAADAASSVATTLGYRDDAYDYMLAAQAAAVGQNWTKVMVIAAGNITLSGLQTIDGYAVQVGDRVAACGQSAAAQNGIWVVAVGAWTRAGDANTWDEIVSKVAIAERGATLGDTAYICISDAGGIIGVTAQTWTPYRTPLADGSVTFYKVHPQVWEYARRINQSAIMVAAYNISFADSGSHILHPASDTTARVVTIPANSTEAFPIGTAITIINEFGAGVITLNITTDTLVLAGSGATGSRTIAPGGLVTLLKTASTRWVISGIGLS